MYLEQGDLQDALDGGGDRIAVKKDLKLIAHIMQRFDLIAVQEVNDEYAAFVRAVELMDGDFDWIINDTGGNRERLGFVYSRDEE